jgi:thioredoxin reductase
MNIKNHSYEVIIIGGSYAGLSAGMALGRSKRSVLIIDGGEPCNRQTPHAHNLITHDGETPTSIAHKAKEQTLAYPTVQFVSAKATALSGNDGNFIIETSSGITYQAQKVLLATGLRDIPLPIEGFAECWGISVLHCPYCHGYEVKDKTLAVIGNGDMGFEFARLIYHWSNNLTLLTNGTATLPEAHVAKINAHGIKIVSTPITRFVHQGGQLQHIVFEDGHTQLFDAVFSRSGRTHHTNIHELLGCALSTEGMFEGLLKTDGFSRTTVFGVYAAGDNCSPMRSLSHAIAAGTTAGAMINHDLIAASF